MRLNKTEREALRKRVEIVISLSKLEIFNYMVSDEELSIISYWVDKKVMRNFF
jgi:hypothetical protein